MPSYHGKVLERVQRLKTEGRYGEALFYAKSTHILSSDLGEDADAVEPSRILASQLEDLLMIHFFLILLCEQH